MLYFDISGKIRYENMNENKKDFSQTYIIWLKPLSNSILFPLAEARGYAKKSIRMRASKT
jgi:hypothetical protein